MYPSVHAAKNPEKPAYIMASTGQVISYGELNERSIQVSRLFRSLGLKVGDHVAILLENHPWFHIIGFGAHRAGLYFTPISSRLTASEVDYIVGDCTAGAFITQHAKSEVAEELTGLMPGVPAAARFMLDGSIAGFRSFEEAVLAQSTMPLEDETSGNEMLYSSGTTGRPKGILRPLSGEPITAPNRMTQTLPARYGFDENTLYLSPAPLYHAAPLGYNRCVLCVGGTVIIMEKFDPEEALKLIEKYRITHSQWVPTMFVRMLKLPEEVRTKYDLSSLKCAVHAAAPCPVPVKKQMIQWWGPVIYEYYAGSEGNGGTAITSTEWLAHKGSVGKSYGMPIHICDDEGNELPTGQSGTIYFEGGATFEYHNDPKKTAESRHPSNTDWSTLGDVGYLDEEGYLFLTDRKAFMIISGGVNIYPQETENLLVTHPKVADCAVFGVPNEEFGEEVKAVVQLMNPQLASPELEKELIQFCRDNISHLKCPRSIDFTDELPRHPTGKLYKRLLKDRYWGNRDSKIV